MTNKSYVPYTYHGLREAAVNVIKAGDPEWKTRPDHFFKTFTVIELVEWAIQDTFIHQITLTSDHDILLSAMIDLRKDGCFKHAY